jgi:hypothetical protein
VSRTDVQVSVVAALNEIADVLERDNQKKLIDELLVQKHKLPNGTFLEVVVNKDKFEELDTVEQGAIISAIYEITKDERVFPENFYNQKEIGKISKYTYKSKDQVIGLPHTFGNYVIQTTDEDFNTSLTYKEVVSLSNAGFIEYNIDIQRNPKEKINKLTGEIKREARVIKKAIKEMTDLMLKKRFRSNQITLLALVDDPNTEISYTDGELTLESGVLYIIDGFHRLSAMINVIEENPDYQAFVDVAIKHLTFDEARHYLGQINKMTKVDKSFVKSLMIEELEDKIVVDLKRKSTGLNGRITDDATVSKYKTYLTSFSILSKGIKDVFEPKDNVDRVNISQVLAFYFDYVIDYYKENFSKDINVLRAAREKSLLSYHNTFVLHLVFAKKLFDKYGKDIPADKIVKLIDSVDFNKDGEFYNVVYREGSGKVNSNKVKREIKEYAEKKADQILSEN